MARKLNYDFAATVLVNAMQEGDELTCHKFGVSIKTIERYKKRVQHDPVLAEHVAQKQQLVNRDWTADILPAMRAAIEFIRRAAESADTRDVNAIQAVAGALKVLSEIYMTQEVLVAKLAGYDRAQPEAAGAMDSYTGAPAASA